jgi:hypothetical protein
MNLINRLAASKNNSRSNAMQLFMPNKKEVSSDKKEVSSASSNLDSAITGVEHPVKNTFNPFEPHSVPNTPEITAPVLEQIVENQDSQIRLGLAHDKALELLNRSVDYLTAKLDDVKADKLPAVVTAASKVVESIRRERSEASKNNKDREVHYHFYTPQQKAVADYEVIEVTQ